MVSGARCSSLHRLLGAFCSQSMSPLFTFSPAPLPLRPSSLQATVYVIDEVLLVKALMKAPPPSPVRRSPPPPPACKSIVDYALGNPELTTIVHLVKKAGLVDVLDKDFVGTGGSPARWGPVGAESGGAGADEGARGVLLTAETEGWL